ncbi:putative late blight resistance protein homolog R1A-4 [Nicotiana tomentosiformis]|uniref:putative late blight resistance protein homolog R1A-4 n=1 Tax=Nicotiana tomentosiformis TaxID=4098 RepID=UPI00388CC4B7
MGKGMAQPASSVATTSTTPPPARGTITPAGRGTARGGIQSSGGPNRFSALWRRQKFEASPDAVTGILTIRSHDVNLLIARLGELLAVPDDSEDIYFQVKDQMKVLVKELTVLKKFVCFLGTIYSPELESCWKDFLSHAEVVATNAATVCFFYLPDSNEDKSVVLGIANSLIDLLQKRIEPIEPRVHDIYADVLLNLRLSGSPPMSTTTLFPLAKDQTETLPDQLKSSRIILNELLLINSIQDEMRNRFFTRLENVAVDAGLVIYSLYDSSKDKEHQKQELIVLADTVQLVKTQVNRDIREWVQSHLPKNDSLGSINFLLESLKALICCPADSLASVKNQLELVHEELEFLQPLLKGAAEQSNNK